MYAQPGTCNCFARTAPVIQPAPGVVPVAPISPFVPYVPLPNTTLPWWQTVTVGGTDTNTMTGTALHPPFTVLTH